MRTFILLALLSITSVACKKDRQAAETGRIIGKWNLVLTTGGLAGLHTTPAQSGHTESMTFRTDNTCTIINNANVTTGSFSIKDEYSADLQKNVEMLHVDGGKYIINYVQDTLLLGMDAVVDGTTDWFVKE